MRYQCDLWLCRWHALRFLRNRSLLVIMVSDDSSHFAYATPSHQEMLIKWNWLNILYKSHSMRWMKEDATKEYNNYIHCLTRSSKVSNKSTTSCRRPTSETWAWSELTCMATCNIDSYYSVNKRLFEALSETTKNMYRTKCYIHSLVFPLLII